MIDFLLFEHSEFDGNIIELVVVCDWCALLCLLASYQYLRLHDNPQHSAKLSHQLGMPTQVISS